MSDLTQDLGEIDLYFPAVIVNQRFCKIKNGSVQSDLQFLHYQSSSEAEPIELVKLLNYNNYQSVCLEVKYHVRRIHQTYDTMYAHQNVQQEQLKEIIAQLGVINK